MQVQLGTRGHLRVLHLLDLASSGVQSSSCSTSTGTIAQLYELLAQYQQLGVLRVYMQDPTRYTCSYMYYMQYLLATQVVGTVATCRSAVQLQDPTAVHSRPIYRWHAQIYISTYTYQYQYLRMYQYTTVSGKQETTAVVAMYILGSYQYMQIQYCSNCHKCIVNICVLVVQISNCHTYPQVVHVRVDVHAVPKDMVSTITNILHCMQLYM